jgi:hypothetical protein
MANEKTGALKASSRRRILKTIAGTSAVVGGLEGTTHQVAAHHDEEPDYEYGVKSERCYRDYTTHSGLKLETWYRGYDDDRHKHKWVTAVGSSAIGEKNDDPDREIELADLQIDWDDDKFDYRAVEPEPHGYSSKAYGYKKAEEPDTACEECNSILKAGAGLLAGYLGGPVGAALWTGGELIGNILAEKENTNGYDGGFRIRFPFKNWANGHVVQSHYEWFFHVYLDFEDRLSINVDDLIYGFNTDAYTSVTLTYRTYEHQYEVYDDVDHSTEFSHSC